MFSVFCVWTVSWIFYCISLGRFLVLWYFDCCIDCIVFLVSLSVSTHCCVNKDYHYRAKPVTPPNVHAGGETNYIKWV